MMPIRVLIADDSARARSGLRALLQTWSEIEVLPEAASGEEAVRLVEEYQPDVVLLDLHMPNLDGLYVTQVIKSRWPEINVIVHTIHAAQRTAALAAGADSFLIKGVPSQRLFNMLRKP